MQSPSENNISPDQVLTSDLNAVSDPRNFTSQNNNVIVSQNNNNVAEDGVFSENNSIPNRVPISKHLVPCPFLRRIEVIFSWQAQPSTSIPPCLFPSTESFINSFAATE